MGNQGNGIMKIWILSIFFDAYAIAYVGTYPITLFTLVTILAVLSKAKNEMRCFKIENNASVKAALLMVVYLIINYCVTGFKNSNSLMLSIMYFMVFIVTTRREKEQTFESHMEFFSKIMNVIAVYGIYQFAARIYNLPFSDIVIDGHMVTGYNWTNRVRFLGQYFYRSNAIFREPSFFSQFLAINLLLLILKFLDTSYKKKTKASWILINAIAMILTFSGTGFIILIVGFLFYAIRKLDNKVLRGRILLILLAGIAVLIALLQTPVGAYFTQRLQEIFVYNTDNFSGYVRFRGGRDVLADAWAKKPFFGTGIGTASEFIKSMQNYYDGLTVNGLYRPAVELGVAGEFFWIVFLGSIVLRKEFNEKFKMLQCIIIPFLICHETFQSNYYWILLYMLNVTLIYQTDDRIYNK